MTPHLFILAADVVEAGDSIVNVTGELPWHKTLLFVLLDVGLVVIGVGVLLCAWRVLRGPHLVDRAVALDAIAVQLVGLVVLLTLRLGQLVLFDGVLVLSLIGFAGTVAISQYILRRRLKIDDAERAGERAGEREAAT